MLKRESTWECMAKFVRAVFPMLIVLRLADQKEPVMDKLYFYVRRMDKTLNQSKIILDDLQHNTHEISWRLLSMIKDDESNDYDDSEASDENNDNTDSETDDEASLGQKVIDIWNKRRNKLVNDFAIAGWMLSPIPDIFEDSTANMTGEHRDAIDRLLKKMFATCLADDSDELALTMNTFWEEFEHFKSKSGQFDKSYIWSSQNRDLTLGKSHLWHKKNSYVQTKILGKFACRVCSKIVGMGSAERNWGDVKHLKSDKRSHLSAEAVEKQATIFGASCMADAALERQKAQESTADRYKFWDESDFDREFDMFATKELKRPPARIIKCYLEQWEEEKRLEKDDVSKAKFLRKYGGLEFDDIDDGTHYTIDSKDMHFQSRGKKTDLGWCVKAYAEEAKDFQKWLINDGCALHDCLATYYRKHPEKNVKVLLLQDQVEEIVNLEAEADATIQKESETASSKSPTKPNSSKKKNQRQGDTSVSSVDLTLCGGCGQKVGPAHKCDICKRNMHPFCGREIGEEGYGSTVRCKKCDEQS